MFKLRYSKYITVPFDLSRFECAVDQDLLRQVLSELNEGKKQTHWMWFIFPSLRGIYQSPVSRRFSIADIDHAIDFMKHETLGPRLVECTRAVMQHKDRTAESIFGPIDAKKFHSSMTLFCLAPNSDPVFQQALELFFDSKPDNKTLDKI